MKKINIFYSHYNVEGRGTKGRPLWFDYENCFKNLLKSIENKNVDLYVVMDGKIESNWISKYKDYYKSYEITGGDITNVTRGVYGFIESLNLPDDELVYVLENDYLHTNGWVDKVVDLYKNFQGLTYISLYDHNDKYFLPMYEDLVSKIFATDTHHWRTTPSTCGSYITTSKIFKEDYNDHIGVTVPVGDHHKWLFLSENKGRFVLTPVPGLSTHCMEGLLSPTVDWSLV